MRLLEMAPHHGQSLGSALTYESNGTSNWSAREAMVSEHILVAASASLILNAENVWFYQALLLTTFCCYLVQSLCD